MIRANYGYDEVQIFLWAEDEKTFVSETLADAGGQPARIPLAESGLLGHTLLRNQPTFIPDMQRSHLFPPDPRLPACRSRVVLPIRFGQQVLGLLDLQSGHSTQHSHLDLVGLQVLGDLLGVAMRNADLYGDAIAAHAEAERASELKGRLLANVSHELRAPLNIIQGYSQSALASPNPYEVDLPPGLLRDLSYLYQSSEHLGRLINDLLDLSRAEINDLDIFPEPIASTHFWKTSSRRCRAACRPAPKSNGGWNCRSRCPGFAVIRSACGKSCSICSATHTSLRSKAISRWALWPPPRICICGSTTRAAASR